MSAVEFRKHAAEHLDWAKTAKSDRERQTFQQMAQAWLEAAVLWGVRCLQTQGANIRHPMCAGEATAARHGTLAV